MALKITRFLGPRLVLILLACCLLARYFLILPLPRQHQPQYQARSPAGNATLGFGAIFALTIYDTTWRIQGLRAAAKLTGLQIRIPVQKRPSDEDAYAYLAGDESAEPLNEVKAMLNYLSLFDAFLATGHETALFIEDDADFSVDIRAHMDAISSIMDQWDVFWIGHAGVEVSTDTMSIRYNDSIALRWDHLFSNFNNYYEEARTKGQMDQEIMNTVAPVGTYGFALTRTTAQMLVRRLRNDRSQKFDVALHILCKGRELRCAAPVPEVVHHHSVIGMETIRLAGEGKGEKEDLSWWRKRHKFTYNIEYSARCNALRVGEKLGDRWQCLPGRYDNNY